MKRKRVFGCRLKKVRGWKKKYRAMVKISCITSEGFRWRTFNRDYYVYRDVFAWFLAATHREIQAVENCLAPFRRNGLFG